MVKKKTSKTSASVKRPERQDSGEDQKAPMPSPAEEGRKEQIREQFEELHRSKNPPKQGPLERGEIKRREHVHRLQRRGEPPRGNV